MKKSAIAALLAQTEQELGAADAELDTFAKAEQSELAEDYDELDAATEESGDGEPEQPEEGADDEPEEGDDEPGEMAKADQGDEGYIDAGPILQELLGEIQGLSAKVDTALQGNAVIAKALQSQGRGIGSFAKALSGVAGQPVVPTKLRVPTKEPQPVVVETDAGTIMAKAEQAIGEGSREISSVDLAKFNGLSQEYGLNAALATLPQFRKFIS